MENFTYHNPVKVLFGKGMIAELPRLLPPRKRILLTFGGGSIKANGVFDQVKRALKARNVVEFGGIEPNPRYETLMKAVGVARSQNIGFLLSVGGGSVLDGTKFIAAAVPYSAGDPWDILDKDAPVSEALPLGCILTLPATGSEMNAFAVVSRASTNQKLAFGTPRVMPQFSILDPETTHSLPTRQVGNGIVDAFTHVMEQYATFDAAAPLQARQAEAILQTLVEIAPRALAEPPDPEARASLMWCATQALNGTIAAGVPQDWSTHMIGHEITALHGLDHAQTLAVILPGVLTHRKERKRKRLAQLGERVFGIRTGNEDARATAAIARTEEFFRSVGVNTRLSEYGVPPECASQVAERLASRCPLGEHKDIGPEDVRAIVASRL
jgi:NADP-dependent alcohol dehydrogenase